MNKFLVFIIILSAGHLFALADSLSVADTLSYQMQTSYGSIDFELYPRVAPNNVKRIKTLIETGYYNGKNFHKVVADFMILTGEPDSTASDLAPLADEINAQSYDLDKILVRDSAIKSQFPHYHPIQFMSVQDYLQKYESYKFRADIESLPLDYGYIAMGNKGADTNTSYFFIITKKTGCAWLNGKHTVIGKVTSSMDVAQKIANQTTNKKGVPDKPVIIHKITKKPPR